MQNHFHAETLLKCRAGLQDMQHTHIEAKVGMACSIPCRSKMKPKMSLSHSKQGQKGSYLWHSYIRSQDI